MLSKELLTRWNRKAIIHAKERDLADLERRRRAPRSRREMLDPRCFVSGDVLTDQGVNVSPKFITPAAPNITSRDVIGGVYAPFTSTIATGWPVFNPIDDWSLMTVCARGNDINTVAYPGGAIITAAVSAAVATGISFSDGNDGNGNGVLLTTDATANRTANIRGTSAAAFQQTRRRGIFLAAKVMLSQLTNTKFFFGVGDVAWTNANDGNNFPINNHWAIIGVNDAVDGNWRLWTCDGGAAGTGTIIGAATTNLAYLYIWMNSVGVYGVVANGDGTVLGGPTTSGGTLPGIDTVLLNDYGTMLVNTAAAAKAYDFYRSIIMAR